MNKWIIPSNLKQYDVIGAFQSLSELTWTQRFKSVEVGDLVYIYVSSVSAIKFCCEVAATNLGDDSELIVEDEGFVRSGEYLERETNVFMRLKKIHEYDDQVLSLDILHEHGLKGRIQGARSLPEGVEAYIDSLEASDNKADNTEQIDKESLQKYVDAFISYELSTHNVDPRETLDGTIMRIKKEEGYKKDIYKRIRGELFTSDSYSEVMMRSLAGGNLVSHFQVHNIVSSLKENGTEEFENALERLFNGNNEKLAFDEIVNVLGARFDVVGFLFFLKDCDRFLPVRSRLFDERLALLGLKSELNGNCTWEKYNQFNKWIEEIREYLAAEVNSDITLLDAHSFVWILPKLDEYLKNQKKDEQLVEHTKYGKGVVIADDGKTITIQFSNETKKFDKKIVLRNGLVTYLDEEKDEIEDPVNSNSLICLLKKSGIDVSKTKLIRHAQSDENFKRCMDAGFVYEYTRLQNRNNFKDCDTWVVFISAEGTSAVLYGCYKVNGEQPNTPDLTPKGFPVPEMFDGSVSYFDLEKIDALDKYEGKLTIEWGKGTQAWNQWATNDKTIISLEGPEQKPETSPRTYIVFQGSHYDKEYEEGYLFAPLYDDKGDEPHHWLRLSELKPEDKVFHYVRGYIRAISTVTASWVEAVRPDSIWDDKGRLVKCDPLVLDNPIKVADYTDDIIKHRKSLYSAFNSSGGANRGYLFELEPEIALIFESVAGSGKPIIHDTELEELIQDKPDVALENQIDEFFTHIGQYKEAEERNEALRKKFVEDYTINAIQSFTKDQYVIGKGTNDSFCYRIEEELRELGDMHGANSSKFGMYYGKSGSDTEEKYRMQKKFGEDPDKALELIKEQIVNLILAGETEDYDAIRECKLWPLFRGKILSTYYPERYLAIFIDEHLDYFISKLSLDIPDSADVLDKQACLVKWKQSNIRLKDISMYLFDSFLYSTFGRPLADIKNAKDAQAQRDREYPKQYAVSIKIKQTEWMALLEDDDVFYASDIELLKKIYLEDNHATTLYDLSIKDGVQSSTYIPQVVGLAKRISKAMNLDPIKRDDGSRVWWRIPFWGRRREDGHFEWKIRPDLAKALVKLYPELDLIGLNEEEDENLISDLKNSTMAEVDDTFEYTGGKKKKPAPVFTNGHKTYPRDRQVAINALAHAHFKCEVDQEHPTFIRKRSDRPYTEPHHLVPMSFSDSFDVSLDREENIVSLCSNCHNEIHYGRDAKILIEKLYSDRKELLESIGISITFDELLEMYGIQNR